MLRNGMASPKLDIVSALNLYSSEREQWLTSSWKRTGGLATGPIRFDLIDVRVLGEQPNLQVRCDCVIVAESAGRPVSIAVDVETNSFPIMQAIPNLKPFIGGAPGTYNVTVDVDLPPLVPGVYSFNFWIGPHNTETFDNVREAVKIEISDSPSAGRTFPHSPDHGFIVPFSRASVRSIKRDSSLQQKTPTFR